MNRLATAQSQATSGTDCWGLSYGYDRYANLLSESVTKCSAPTLNLSVSTSTNQVTNTGFTYDAAGELTGDGSATYTWNAAGLMATTAGVTYTYDGDGQRVKKSSGKLYWYGPGGQVIAEGDTSGNITSEFIFFGGMRIARRDVSSGNFYNFLGDRLGNARVVTDSSGTVVEASDYYPFGQERVVTGTGTANNYKYTGHERDTESGLDHTQYRQLSSAQGRWLSADPKRGSPANPQSWNRYSYGNNPCNGVDPDGGQFVIDYQYTEINGSRNNPYDASRGYTNGYVYFTPLPSKDDDWTPTSTELRQQQAEMEDWIALSSSCQDGLRGALSGSDNSADISARMQALYRAYEAVDVLSGAGESQGIDPRMLAAIGIRESHFGDPNYMIQDGGPGRGVFQIEAGPHGSHEGLISVEDAMTLGPAASYTAINLAKNLEQITKAFPGLDQDSLSMATAASWGRGAQGVINDINSGMNIEDIKGGYGSNITNLMQCFKPVE